MPSLKHYIAGTAGVSHLSQSPLWDQDVATITPAQLIAFVAKHKINYRADEAESAIDIAITQITEAVNRGDIARPPMLDYTRPNFIVMTQTELRRGLAFMRPEQAYAIMFALETGMSSQEVARLKHIDLHSLRRDRRLSELATACLERSPRHIVSPYVFWRPIQKNGRTVTASTPIMDLDEAVFDAFGLVWGELEQGYANLIHTPDDDEVDGPLFDLMFGR